MAHLSRRALFQATAASALGLGLGLRQDWLAAAQTPVAATPTASALDDLRRRLRGTLMLPADSGFASASVPANGRYRDILPQAVARVADEADVVTCVQWCTEHGVAPVVRGGGHSYAGFSTTTELLLDLRRLNHVDVDHAAGTVVAGGAALNNDFFIALENSPHFLPGGTCLGVGIGGLTLGGGIGYNTHWAGLTADHLTASRIVTASGEVLTIDDATNSDLFWACRGGAGGSFGINTEFSFNLVESPGDIAYYRYEWYGADDAMAAYAAFDALIQNAPAALNAVIMAEAIPVEGGDERAAIHVMSRGQYIGPVSELEELIAPLREAAAPAKMTVAPMPFWTMQRLIATGEPLSHSFGDISRYANAAMPSAVISDLVELLVECPGRTETINGSIWSLGWVGGEVTNRIARAATAYVHRGVTTLWRPTTVWDDTAPDSVAAELNAWTEAVIAVLAPHTPHESYQNFPNRAISDWAEQYYAENYPRLVEVKTAYDPANLFRNPQSIPPA